AESRAAPRSRAPHALPQAEVMDAVAREEQLVQEIEAVAPEQGIERIHRENVELHSCVEQPSHVALEERRDPRRILAREDRQPHVISGLMIKASQCKRRT